MKSFNGIIVVLLALILATGNISMAQDTTEVKTFTISGNVGIEGVVMQGLPGNPVTDEDGFYSVTVANGWVGGVTPAKEGFSFSPPRRQYNPVNRNWPDQDFAAEVVTYTISGNVGTNGAVMRGLPGDPVSDLEGFYKASVDYGWSGRVTPVKEGYKFNPPYQNYTNIVRDMLHQNFEPVQITQRISGDINIGGVFLEGLPGAPITDKDGRYSTKVPYGFNGTVIPKKEGYEFTPTSRTYSAAIVDLDNQDYFAELKMLTISDTVEIDGAPIPGVRVSTNDGLSTVTDSKGRYNLRVPYGWSGEISLSKEGYTFDPSSKPPFINVTTNIRDGVSEPPTPPRSAGMYAARSRGRVGATLPPAFGRAGGRRILIVPVDGTAPKDYLETREDLYIMSEILDERFKEPRMIQGVFRDFGDFFGRDNRQTDAVYMQGYGVVFMMEVDYTFTPAPQTQQQPEEQTKEVDSTWQRARENIFSPGGAGRISRPESSRANDAQMVEEFKTELIRTLRHATNIRNIEPDEWVIFSVTGTGPQSGMMGGWGEYVQSSDRYQASSSSRVSGYGGSTMGGGGMGGYGGSMGGRMYSGGGVMSSMGGNVETGVLPATVLTIRAKKSDVDTFAKDEIDYQQFQQKVQILMYRSSL